MSRVREGRELEDMCTNSPGAFRCLRGSGHQQGYCVIKGAQWDGGKLAVRGCNLDRGRLNGVGRPLMFQTGWAMLPFLHPLLICC